jgi:translation initiation factor IF-1
VRVEGTVVARLRNATRVTLDNGHVVLAPLSGRMMGARVKVAVGDRVKVEMSPYDLRRGRIVHRYY